MSRLAQQVSATGLRDRIFNERQLADTLGGGKARRYGAVNRALKDGSLVRLKRGTYALAQPFRSGALHPFVVAQALHPGSYISFESALAYHGWIPEAVFVTASVTPGRKTLEFPATPFGTFKYHPLAIEDYGFLNSVQRVPFEKHTAFVARPLRALMDLVALRKVPWSGLNWLSASMRIDDEVILALPRKDFAALKQVYKHKSANSFLLELEGAVAATKRLQDGKMPHD